MNVRNYRFIMPYYLFDLPGAMKAPPTWSSKSFEYASPTVSPITHNDISQSVDKSIHGSFLKISSHTTANNRTGKSIYEYIKKLIFYFKHLNLICNSPTRRTIIIIIIIYYLNVKNNYFRKIYEQRIAVKYSKYSRNNIRHGIIRIHILDTFFQSNPNTFENYCTRGLYVWYRYVIEYGFFLFLRKKYICNI